MSVHHRTERLTLHHGDCREVLAGMPDCSVDSIVTDPPYGLEFMGEEWDRPWAVSAENSVGYAGRDALRLPSHRDNRNANCLACGGRQRGKKRCDCASPRWDRHPAEDMAAFQLWCQEWATEALRVLKPGGHLLAFGGTRTYHRMACAIEDAGFEIRDSIHWLYGSGFPKSLDVSKAIDKAAGAERAVVGRSRRYGGGTMGGASFQVSPEVPDVTAPATPDAEQWQGWGTALKPAHEPVVVARKPLAGTVAANVLAHGTGALNIDGCRVGTEDRFGGGARATSGFVNGYEHDGWTQGSTLGRWPANVVLDGDAAAELDRQSGTDDLGASRYFFRADLTDDDLTSFRYVAKPDRTERDAGLGSLAKHKKPMLEGSKADPNKLDEVSARFLSQPLANIHPTVKPLDLMRWLVRLVTPPGGTVLDPFAGSGTTLAAGLLEGFTVVGIELTDDYLPLIVGRCEWAERESRFGPVVGPTRVRKDADATTLFDEVDE